MSANKSRRIFLYVDGILILLACPFLVKGLILSTDWQEKLLWGLGLLFGIPSGVLCIKTARKGSNDEVDKALKDLSSD